MTPMSPPGRPADRKNEIIRALRHRIVSGEWNPGTRLPTRNELIDSFDASSVTVQRALDELIKDGFVRVSGRHGTFVAPEPPHLHRYAVAFPMLPTETHRWVRFWVALNNQCLGLQAAGQRDLQAYYGVGGLRRTDDWDQLEETVQGHRLAGLIFASAPFSLENSPLLTEPNIPRVAIKSPGAKPDIPTVRVNRESFMDKALELIAASGRKRVAFLMAPGRAGRAYAEQRIRELDLISRPYWWQVAPLNEPEAACGAVHLLMHPGQAERPEALVICDDNFTEAAAAGLMAAGVQTPHDLEVIAHCNFPWPDRPVVPMRRLGFDARRVMAACFESIDAQRRGEDVPMVTDVDAQFEDELELQPELPEFPPSHVS